MKIQLFSYLVFDSAFQIFVGLLKFSWDPWCLRSHVVCKNPISEQNFTTKHFQPKFSILVHCVTQL